MKKIAYTTQTLPSVNCYFPLNPPINNHNYTGVNNIYKILAIVTDNTAFNSPGSFFVTDYVPIPFFPAPTHDLNYIGAGKVNIAQIQKTSSTPAGDPILTSSDTLTVAGPLAQLAFYRIGNGGVFEAMPMTVGTYLNIYLQVSLDQ